VVGASSEVNVSFKVREHARRIVKPNEDESKPPLKLMETAFDLAYTDITTEFLDKLIVEFDASREFQIESKKSIL
jgi:hypothetical protein